MTTTIDSDKVIAYYTRRLSGKWEVINQTDKGIQIKKIKKVNMAGVLVGLCLIPFWGIGFIMWLLVIIDYILMREKVMFISLDQMITQLKAGE